ncbi:MAG: recombinase family protein [Lachnospiraceae bacterium]|nr:recombinase family protein [Lachnospiraceae bacterium]
MNIAYVRISTPEQSNKSQKEALDKHNIDKWVYEVASDKIQGRKEFNEMLENLNDGDNVYVYDCSRITRDKDDFLDVVNVIRSKKASLISISQELDTSSPDADNKIKVLMGLETEE